MKQTVPAAILVALSLPLFSCGQRGSVVDRVAKLPEGFDLRMLNEADSAEVLLAPRSGDLKFSRIELRHHLSDADRAANKATNKNQAVSQLKTVRVVADSGEAKLYSGRFSLRGAVRIDDGAGQILDAPSAAYDPDSHSFAGAGPASLRGPNYVLNADQGYVVDTQKNTLDLIGPVRGSIKDINETKR